MYCKLLFCQAKNVLFSKAVPFLKILKNLCYFLSSVFFIHHFEPLYSIEAKLVLVPLFIIDRDNGEDLKRVFKTRNVRFFYCRNVFLRENGLQSNAIIFVPTL